MSTQFKVGDKVKALSNTLDITAGNTYKVIAVDGTHSVEVVDDAGVGNWALPAKYYELVEDETPRVFKAGDVVTLRQTPYTIHGFTPGREYVVTRVREANYPRGSFRLHFERDDHGSTIRHRPAAQFELVRGVEDTVTPAPYFLVSSKSQKFDSVFATTEAAKEFITDYGTPCTEYTIHEVRDVGTFSVARELKEVA